MSEAVGGGELTPFAQLTASERWAVRIPRHERFDGIVHVVESSPASFVGAGGYGGRIRLVSIPRPLLQGEAGLVSVRHLSVDGTEVRAN